mmetsp:Transcript_104028/g.299450  ORF Transcript_104028/g.299450 Transcript_104028/m.299450 type:complete len:283 (+) Transcript_104028:340-1188(+)
MNFSPVLASTAVPASSGLRPVASAQAGGRPRPAGLIRAPRAGSHAVLARRSPPTMFREHKEPRVHHFPHGCVCTRGLADFVVAPVLLHVGLLPLITDVWRTPPHTTNAVEPARRHHNADARRAAQEEDEPQHEQQQVAGVVLAVLVPAAGDLVEPVARVLLRLAARHRHLVAELPLAILAHLVAELPGPVLVRLVLVVLLLVLLLLVVRLLVQLPARPRHRQAKARDDRQELGAPRRPQRELRPQLLELRGVQRLRPHVGHVLRALDLREADLFVADRVLYP